MEDSHDKRWSLGLVVLAIVGSMALLGYLSLRFLPSSTGAGPASNPGGRDIRTASFSKVPADWSDDTGASLYRPVKTQVVLHRDIDTHIGNAIVTYRGRKSGSEIKLDVVILDLDPDVTYSRIINIDRAKNGFQLGDESLQLISARKLRLYVWHTE